MATITGLYRYAVKSFAGEALESARLTPEGLAGDRRYAFIDSAPNRAGKPLTARQLNAMLTYGTHDEAGRLSVATPSGRALEIDSPLLQAELEAALGRSLTLRDRPGAHFDDSPLLVLNLASIRRLGAALDTTLDPRRFRANLLLEGLEPDAENQWPGLRLQAGSAVLQADVLCERCVMVTYDPDTTAADPAILRELTSSRQALLGVYCRVLQPGSVVLGDSVEPV